MGQSNVSRAPEGIARPSLLNAAVAAPAPNILDAMGKRSAAPSSTAKSNNPPWWVLLLLVAAAGWGLWRLSLERGEPAPASPPPNGTLAQSPAPELGSPIPQAVHAEASVVPPLGDVTPMEVATTSVFETPQTSIGQTPATVAAASANPFDGWKTGDDHAAPPPDAAPADQAPPALQAPTEAQPKTPAHALAKAKAVEPVAKTKPPSPTIAAVAKAPSKSRPRGFSAAKRAATSDPDVALIDAIMKHMGDRQTPIAKAEPSPQTIAELVKSCQSKDSIEGLLCRRRICEGSWGKAQACPLELAPRKSSAATPTPPQSSSHPTTVRAPA